MLFDDWWSTSAIASSIRRQLTGGLGRFSGEASRFEQIVYSILDIPINVAIALVLSFLICIDFPRLRTGFRRLRETWLRDAYDEIVPALSGLGQLVGRLAGGGGLPAQHRHRRVDARTQKCCGEGLTA